MDAVEFPFEFLLAFGRKINKTEIGQFIIKDCYDGDTYIFTEGEKYKTSL